MTIMAFKKLPEHMPSWIEREICDINRIEPPIIDTSFYDHNKVAKQVNEALVSAKMAVEHYDHLLKLYKQTVEFDERRITDICQAYHYIAKEKRIEFDDVKKFLDEQEKQK
ncbi:MAG: hypothetical protein M0R51_11695 [Clostridia bacterium]|nr:hypothetical protein [Clostridia bacterium]